MSSAGLWAAIAGGSGQYLKQEEEKRIAEKERLAAELRKQERDQELARDDARHKETMNWNKEGRELDTEARNQERIDRQAEQTRIQGNALWQQGMQTRQFNETVNNRKATQALTALSRAAQVENKAIREQHAKEKEAEIAARSEYKDIVSAASKIKDDPAVMDAVIGIQASSLPYAERVADLKELILGYRRKKPGAK